MAGKQEVDTRKNLRMVKRAGGKNKACWALTFFIFNMNRLNKKSFLLYPLSSRHHMTWLAADGVPHRRRAPMNSWGSFKRLTVQRLAGEPTVQGQHAASQHSGRENSDAHYLLSGTCVNKSAACSQQHTHLNPTSVRSAHFVYFLLNIYKYRF